MLPLLVDSEPRTRPVSAYSVTNRCANRRIAAAARARPRERQLPGPHGSPRSHKAPLADVPAVVCDRPRPLPDAAAVAAPQSSTRLIITPPAISLRDNGPRCLVGILEHDGGRPDPRAGSQLAADQRLGSFVAKLRCNTPRRQPRNGGQRPRPTGRTSWRLPSPCAPRDRLSKSTR